MLKMTMKIMILLMIIWRLTTIYPDKNKLIKKEPPLPQKGKISTDEKIHNDFLIDNKMKEFYTTNFTSYYDYNNFLSYKWKTDYSTMPLSKKW